MFGCHVNRVYLQGVKKTSNHPFISTFIEMTRQMALNVAGLEMKAAAIFVANPHSRLMTLYMDEQQDLKEYSKKNSMRLVAHNTYAASPWSSKENAYFVKQQTIICQNAGITGFVVHLPMDKPTDFIQTAKLLMDDYAKDVRIYLETPAVIPSNADYETPAKLASLLESLKEIDPKLERFGICIDTAHLWTSGVNLRTYAEGAEYIDQMDRSGIDPKLVMFHLNDSRREQGHGPDAHAALGQGRIWGDMAPEKTGAAAFLEYSRKHSLMCIAEVNTIDTLHFSFQFMKKII